MLKFNLKLVLRNLLRQKIYSIINIAGLSIGLAGTFIMLLYVSTELRFDRQNRNLKRIYKVNQELTTPRMTLSTAPYVLTTQLRTDLPETFTIARYFNLSNSTIKYDNKVFKEAGVYCADNELFKILTFDIIEGDPQNFLREPNTIVITRNIAKKYFGDISPLGKYLTFENNGDVYTLTVTGLINDLPVESTFRPEVLINIEIALKQLDKIAISPGDERKGAEYYATVWPFGLYFTTLVLVPVNFKPENLEKIISGYEGRYFTKDPMEMKFKLQPYKDIYFHSGHISGGDGPRGTMRSIYIYSIIAVILMLTSSLNYILISTSRSTQRLKEIGMRMAGGAGRMLIIRQIIGETIFVSMIALPLGISLAEIFLPHVSQPLFNKLLTVNYFENWLFTLGLIIITILIGAFSGAYLAFKILRSNPLDNLKKVAGTGSGKAYFTKSLNIIQITISIILIICAGTIYSQIKYFKSANLGFKANNVLSFNIDDAGVRNNYEALKNRIRSYPKVENITASVWAIPTLSSIDMVIPRVDDQTQKATVEGLLVDYNFVSTLGLKLLEGRDFSEDMENETGNIIISRKAIEALGIERPLGTKLRFGTIIGVVEDFHITSFRSKLSPVILAFKPQQIRTILVKLNPENIPASIEYLKGVWKEFAIEKPFEYTFLTDSLNELYSEDDRFGKILLLFSGLTLFIALLGIFGMSMINVEKKTRQISVRKVFGATPAVIIIKLSFEFFIQVLVAIIIAFPLAYFLMIKWLQNFEYHDKINLWIFVFSGLLSAIMVFLTIIYQVIKVADSNPAETLKYE